MGAVRLGLLLLLSLCSAAFGGWRVALPGWEYRFPRDHGNHPDFKTEWWYFTGNLTASDGREFGYQLTFFRQGVLADDLITLSRFVTRDIKFAHFALSDLSTPKFHFRQKISRGAFGEAGFERGERLAWIDDWSCDFDGTFRIKARDGGTKLDLTLKPSKPPAIQGQNGVSQKSTGEGEASHYYSLTRLQTTGSLTIDGRELKVEGDSWFDHEWATNQLAADQVGWDWFSLQFDDNTELMLFQLRKRDGQRDSHSSGLFVAADGSTTFVSDADFTLEPGRLWKSPASAGEYPLEWKLSIPKLELSATVRAAAENQELVLSPIVYWEGAIRAEGTRQGKLLKAKGYLEMTGYGSEVVGMQSAPRNP